MTPHELDSAIDFAIKSDISAEKAFGYCLTTQSYVLKSTCFTASYSMEEAVVSSVLLQLYFELHGIPDDLNVPEGRVWVNSPADLIWPGAFYLVSSTRELASSASWKAIKKLLP